MRRALLVPAMVLLLATGCGDADDDAAAPSPTAAPTAAPTTTGPATTAATDPPAPTPTPDDAQAVTITVAGGQVTGDTGRAEVPLGSTVRLTVTADVADEIHVHGYDLTAQTTPGQPTSLEFVADQPGVFEIEMHDSRTVLTRLQVQ